MIFAIPLCENMVTAVALISVFLMGVLVGYCVDKTKCCNNPDADAETRQQIYDGLTKLKQDIESTVN